MVERDHHAGQAWRPRRAAPHRGRAARTSRSSIEQALRRDRAPLRRSQLGLHPGRQDRPARRRQRPDRPARARLANPPVGRVASGHDGQDEARPRGRPRAVSRTGRIRRHGLRRLPGPAWTSDRPGRAGARAGPPRRVSPRIRVDSGRSDGRRGACHRAGDRLHLARAADGDGSSVRRSGRSCPADVAIGPLTRVALGLRSRRAATRTGVPLQRLERAAQSAARAHASTSSRTASTSTPWHDAARPWWAGTTSRPSGAFSTAAGPDRLRGPGPQAGPPGHDRRGRATPSCGRWCAASWPRSSASGWAGPRRRTWSRELRSPGRAFDGAVAPAQGLCLRRVAIGPSRTKDNDKEARQGP